MPKPILNDNGNGMHIHQSLWNDDEPVFAGDDYGGLPHQPGLRHPARCS